ncbi:MAG: hypothetical protein LQ338_005001, partial [Usnochroma carphineum]
LLGLSESARSLLGTHPLDNPEGDHGIVQSYHLVNTGGLKTPWKRTMILVSPNGLVKSNLLLSFTHPMTLHLVNFVSEKLLHLYPRLTPRHLLEQAQNINTVTQHLPTQSTSNNRHLQTQQSSYLTTDTFKDSKTSKYLRR